jgi:hypothetical protein
VRKFRTCLAPTRALIRRFVLPKPGQGPSKAARDAGFYVFAGELFWGQDRLDMLEGAIVRSAPGNLGRGPG